jgi:hypothetical protein
MLPQIAAMLNEAAEGAAAQLGNLAQAAQHPHLLDDATLDQVRARLRRAATSCRSTPSSSRAGGRAS